MERNSLRRLKREFVDTTQEPVEYVNDLLDLGVGPKMVGESELLRCYRSGQERGPLGPFIRVPQSWRVRVR